MTNQEKNQNEAIVNFKSPDDRPDPRESWKGDIAVTGGPRFGAAKVPDAITQTDNSEKRLQNAQMRARQRAEENEPEALKQMRLAREREEAEAAAAADARQRADTGNFIAGQDVREQRLIDEFARQKQQQQPPGSEPAAAAGAPDIRLRVKAMQKGGGGASGSRAPVDREALLHQSQRAEQLEADAAAVIAEFANRALPEALGAAALALAPGLAAEAARANTFMNGALTVPSGRVVEMDAGGMTVDAQARPSFSLTLFSLFPLSPLSTYLLHDPSLSSLLLFTAR